MTTITAVGRPVPPVAADAPTPTPTTRQRRVSWDVLRVLAIGSVVVQHATYTVAAVLPWLSHTPFTWSVEAGANTLMVVSAFFACSALAAGRPGRWWVRRLARLLPAYVVAVVVTYVATLLAAGSGYWRPTLGDLVGNLLLVQSWDPSVVYMDHSYWTLPAQLTMFTLAALAAAHLGRRVWGRRWTLPAVAWAGVVVPVVASVSTDRVVRLAFDGMVMDRWQLFAMGLGLWLWSRGRLAGWHLVALLAAGLVAEQTQAPDVASVLVLALACAVAAWAAVGRDGVLARLGPVRRVISWLAGISYGVYLLNQQLGYFEAWWLQARFGLGGWPRLAIVLATAVLLGWLLTVLVERPAYRRLVGQSRGKDAAAARNRSFCSGEPTVTRTPSPANARTTTLPSSACSENSAARAPSGSQTKLACDGGTS